MAPDLHLTGAFCLYQITVPRFQTLVTILAGDCVPFLMKLCRTCGGIVKKVCQKGIKKELQENYFLLILYISVHFRTFTTNQQIFLRLIHVTRFLSRLLNLTVMIHRHAKISKYARTSILRRLRSAL